VKSHWRRAKGGGASGWISFGRRRPDEDGSPDGDRGDGPAHQRESGFIVRTEQEQEDAKERWRVGGENFKGVGGGHRADVGFG